MNDNHLLAQRVFIYDRKTQIEDPKDCEYDDKLGAWLWGEGKEFLVKSSNPGRPRPATKKKDIETGEDLKGV
jgi:hypothetical protein